MTFLDAPAASGQDARLLTLWRDASLAAGWRRTGDWHGPATEAMAHAVAHSEGEDSSAGLLGADRAARGVGLGEAFTDLDALYWSARSVEPPFAVVRAFAQSWTEVVTASLLTRGATDALTGLGTTDYLVARLREVYAEERATGIPTSEAWCTIQVGAPGDPSWRAMLDRVSRARIVASVLDGGESTAVLDSGTVVGLARTPSAQEHALRLRRRLGELEGGMALVRVAPLPATREAALRELLTL
jgi:hypothetical protein